MRIHPVKYIFSIAHCTFEGAAWDTTTTAMTSYEQEKDREKEEAKKEFWQALQIGYVQIVSN